MRGRHPDPTEMVAYARGGLDDDAAAALLEHCESCRDCGNQLAAVLLLRQSRESRAYPRRWIAAAAAAVLVVGLGIGAYWLQDGRESAAAPHGDEATEAAAATVSFSDLASRRIPEWYFRPFDKALEEFAAVPADAGNPPLVPIFRRAIAAMKEGRHGRAVELLTPCCSERFHPWGTSLLGVALFAEGEDLDRAGSMLAKVAELRPDSEGQMAAWFLANIHLLREEPEVALRRLRDIDGDVRAGVEAERLIPRVEERLRAGEGSRP